MVHERYPDNRFNPGQEPDLGRVRLNKTLRVALGMRGRYDVAPLVRELTSAYTISRKQLDIISQDTDRVYTDTQVGAAYNREQERLAVINKAIDEFITIDPDRLALFSLYMARMEEAGKTLEQTQRLRTIGERANQVDFEDFVQEQFGLDN